MAEYFNRLLEKIPQWDAKERKLHMCTADSNSALYICRINIWHELKTHGICIVQYIHVEVNMCRMESSLTQKKMFRSFCAFLLHFIGKPTKCAFNLFSTCTLWFLSLFPSVFSVSTLIDVWRCLWPVLGCQ